MGFPTAYAEQMLPKLIFSFLRTFILAILKLLGVSPFLEPQICWADTGPEIKPVSSSIIQEMLPVMKFADIGSGYGYGAEQCAICLNEFRDYEEIRRLRNCSHIFHKGCVDRWMDDDQISCPLCRTPFVPDELMESYHEKLGAAIAMASSSVIPEFDEEFSVINHFL
ncbi:unnamed protein product [Amaranthus hypochondriacus]